MVCAVVEQDDRTSVFAVDVTANPHLQGFEKILVYELAIANGTGRAHDGACGATLAEVRVDLDPVLPRSYGLSWARLDTARATLDTFACMHALR